LFTTASSQNYSLLRSFGAREVFDYRQPDVTDQLLKAAKKSASTGPAIPFVLDCIGSKSASLAPIAKIAHSGSKVAALLPVIVRDVSDTDAPEYSFDVRGSANWALGVIVSGVRTDFYLNVRIAITYF
jgi:hypothetical protein